MARRRFFVPEVRNGAAELEGEEARHLTQVLRVETGEVYEISDNDAVYLAEVETARKQHVAFRVIEALAPDPAPIPVSIYVALIKFERLEVLFEKATELGVTRIHLVETERSERGLERAAPKRMPRWRRIILEASQQSRRSRMPELHGPMRLKQALGAEAGYRLFLDELRTGPSIVDVVQGAAATAILAGPEGGWTEHERQEILAAGWASVSLGPLVLRTETACVAAASVLSSVFASRSNFTS